MVACAPGNSRFVLLGTIGIGFASSRPRLGPYPCGSFLPACAASPAPLCPVPPLPPPLSASPPSRSWTPVSLPNPLAPSCNTSRVRRSADTRAPTENSRPSKPVSSRLGHHRAARACSSLELCFAQPAYSCPAQEEPELVAKAHSVPSESASRGTTHERAWSGPRTHTALRGLPQLQTSRSKSQLL